MSNEKRIALGMSGGVDSATSAIFLKRAGYEVVGVTALFLDSEDARSAARDAANVCKLLGIQHLVRDCTANFECEVVTPFVKGYAQGLTPSPCVECNACAKIPVLMEAAHDLGCEKIATGHYARVAQLSSNGRYIVKTALDYGKDQSYMLSQLNQNQLSCLLLPLGAVTKAEVRIVAQDAGLIVANKAESQDLCFIKGKYHEFLSERGLAEKPGNIVNEAGTVLGQHLGLAAYTIGQRKGIGVAGPQPYYVLAKRAATNELVVGFAEDTYITKVIVKNPNWQAFERLENGLECMVKLRYRAAPAACRIIYRSETSEKNTLCVELQSPQSITAPGQYAVFYQGEDALGGGVISATLRG